MLVALRQCAAVLRCWWHCVNDDCVEVLVALRKFVDVLKS
jgi:hypothetical protein